MKYEKAEAEVLNFQFNDIFMTSSAEENYAKAMAVLAKNGYDICNEVYVNAYNGRTYCKGVNSSQGLGACRDYCTTVSLSFK